LYTKTIKKLIADAIVFLHQEYCDGGSKYIISTWKQFQKFCDAKNYSRYSSLHKDDFIAELSTRNPPLLPVTIKRKSSQMKMLDSFAHNGAWVKGNLNPLPELQLEFYAFLGAQDNWLVKIGRSECTCETMRKRGAHYLRYFQSIGVTKLSEIDDTHVSSCILTLKGHAKSTMRCELSFLRKFFSNLYLLGYSADNLSVHVPQYNLGQSDSWLKIWESDEINKLLETIDTASPKGKRDAAYIIIASELGMRSGDIRNLKLSDFDWDACSISFTQRKTGHPNTLPLNEKVGSAVIDYLRVRPQTDCEYLFIQLIPPYGQMVKFNTSFYKYLHRSGVKVEVGAHHGLHSLRATVATKLLAANVSPDVIFPFLGHSDRDTLGSYIRYDIENLRECALSFEGGELI
jgi:integrase